MARTPVYILFAGADGAGKSTLNASGLWKDDRFPKKTLRVVPKEIVEASSGGSKSAASQQAAEEEALALADAYIDTRKSLCHETSLAFSAAEEQIAHAHSQGYRVCMFYVGTDDPLAAAARSGRALEGEEARRRWRNSLGNLSRAVTLCDEVCVFDNTQQLTSLAVWEGGSLSWWGGVRADRSWLASAIKDRQIWRPGAA